MFVRMDMRHWISALEDDDVEHLKHARKRAGELLNLDRQPELEDLQAALDAGLAERASSEDLRCLGVAFGDILCRDPRFSWAIVEDEFGRDPTVRWREDECIINAMTIISNRVDKGETIDIQYLFEWAYKTCEAHVGRRLN